MTVPPETAIDALAAHGLISRYDVLDIASQQVSVMGQAVGEGRAVVEDEFIGSWTRVDRTLKRLLFDPTLQDVAFNSGKICPARYSRIMGVV